MNRTIFSLFGSIAILLIGNQGCTWSSDSSGSAPGNTSVDASSDAPVDAPADAPIVCPSCDELLTWDTSKHWNTTYGAVSTNSTWSDSYARQMLIACDGWSIYDGHDGGIGDTLEIASCNDGVVLVWMGDRFSGFNLSQGWTGKTSTGIAIGSSYADFIQAYPDYEGDSTLINGEGSATLNYANGLVFFKNSVLTELLVF